MNQEPEHFPINGVLDLHTFKPGDISSLIPEYIEACLDKNITSLRIIHGKGTAVLRRGVHALLDTNPHVVSFGLATTKAAGAPRSSKSAEIPIKTVINHEI